MVTVPFSDFQKLDLRVGEIKKVEDVEGYDKLYKISVDLGELGERILIAGIKLWYTKEALIGLQVVVVVNLQPKRLAGLDSQGMLLAADVDGRAVLVMPCDKVSPGTKVR